jgi:hypothetical protein
VTAGVFEKLGLAGTPERAIAFFESSVTLEALQVGVNALQRKV